MPDYILPWCDWYDCAAAWVNANPDTMNAILVFGWLSGMAASGFFGALWPMMPWRQAERNSLQSIPAAVIMREASQLRTGFTKHNDFTRSRSVFARFYTRPDADFHIGTNEYESLAPRAAVPQGVKRQCLNGWWRRR